MFNTHYLNTQTSSSHFLRPWELFCTNKVWDFIPNTCPKYHVVLRLSFKTSFFCFALFNEIWQPLVTEYAHLHTRLSSLCIYYSGPCDLRTLHFQIFCIWPVRGATLIFCSWTLCHHCKWIHHVFTALTLLGYRIFFFFFKFIIAPSNQIKIITVAFLSSVQILV